VSKVAFAQTCSSSRVALDGGIGKRRCRWMDWVVSDRVKEERHAGFQPHPFVMAS